MNSYSTQKILYKKQSFFEFTMNYESDQEEDYKSFETQHSIQNEEN